MRDRRLLYHDHQRAPSHGSTTEPHSRDGKFPKIESTTNLKLNRECRAWLIFGDSSNAVVESENATSQLVTYSSGDSWAPTSSIDDFWEWWLEEKSVDRFNDQCIVFATFRYHNADCMIVISYRMPYLLRSSCSLDISPWRSPFVFLLSLDTDVNPTTTDTKSLTISFSINEYQHQLKDL